MAAVTVTGEQRDALREHLLGHLSGIGDIWFAIQREDYERAERMGREFSEELRLLADLGWAEGPVSELVELRMPADELHRLFARLHGVAEDRRRSQERDEAEREDEVWETRLFAEACDRVLEVVSRVPPEPL